MGIILYILSVILRTIVVTLAMLYNSVKLIKESHIGRVPKYIDQSFFEMAKAVDKYGNVVCATMFNDLLITKESKHLFGADGQYISGVLGLNFLDATLTKTGLFINNSLNYFWRDHTIRAAKGITEKPATSDFVLLLISIKNFITFKNLKMKLTDNQKFALAGAVLAVPAFIGVWLLFTVNSYQSDLHKAWASHIVWGILLIAIPVTILAMVYKKWKKNNAA